MMISISVREGSYFQTGISFAGDRIIIALEGQMTAQDGVGELCKGGEQEFDTTGFP